MDGHQVRIYERSVTGLAGRGAGLVGQRDIFAILRAVGCEHVAHVDVVALERITFDRDGGVVHRQATPQMQISWDYLYSAFRALVAGDDYVLGHAVRSVRQTDEFVSLDFEDGSEEVADLVIGADGVGSVVRQAVTGESSLPPRRRSQFLERVSQLLRDEDVLIPSAVRRACAKAQTEFLNAPIDVDEPRPPPALRSPWNVAPADRRAATSITRRAAARTT
jgi:2-polyprenyl-6-methoxyphenol hydroxylase-like FAD-dependent oxidoreductase